MKQLIKVLGLAPVILSAILIMNSTLYAGDAVQPIVSTKWVADNISSIKIIDVSKKGYAKGHIPGAVQIKWGSEVFAPETDHMVLGLAEIERVVSKMGVTQNDPLISDDRAVFLLVYLN